MLLLAVVATVLSAFLNAAADDSRASSSRTGHFETKRSASSINRLAAQFVWTDYARTTGGDDTNFAALRAHLDGMGLVDQAGSVPVPKDLTNALSLPVNAAGELTLGDTTVQSVKVHREDDGRAVSLFVTAVTTTMRGRLPQTSTMTDVFSIDAPVWEGLNFALLANNINCIMCHASVDDVTRVYGMGGVGGLAEQGRARVGSLESFQFREDPDSTIAGTLYLGGTAVDRHGDPITDWGSLNLKAAEVDSEGYVISDAFGTLTMVDLDPADPSAPAPYENLYLNYLSAPNQVDGVMPGSFPLPFRDDGGLDPATGTLTPGGEGNREVDDNEFSATVASFTGSVQGGRIGVSPIGDQVTTAAAASALLAGTQPDLTAETDGNVIMTGTELNPIRISGDVAIDGDLIISGPIEGAGSLWVRGNIYVRGDLEYNDVVVGSDRRYGISASGRTNALGLTAGGNVIVGDIHRPRWGEGSSVTGESNGEWNFTLGQAAAFNGREWVKTQSELPGKAVLIEITETVGQELFIETTEVTQEPVYKWVPTGTFWDKPVGENVVVGHEEQPVYESVFHASTLHPPYDNSWTEQVQTGTTLEPIYEWQQTGTVPEEIHEQVVDYLRDVTHTIYTSYSPQQFANVDVTRSEWQTPLFPNPDYRGPHYKPRYYQFGPGDPIPVQNKDGYFDDVKGLWVMDEGVSSWDEAKLTLADPSDPADPILFPSGSPNAAVTTLEPTDGWMDADILQGMVTDTLQGRDPSEPFKVDATIYSANSVFGVVPNSASAGTSGTMRVQGAVLAADIGLLAPLGLELLFDERGQDVLDIRDEANLGLRFIGSLPAALP